MSLPPLPVHLQVMELMGADRWEEASLLLEQADAGQASHPLGLFLLGACRCQLGQDEEGIAFLERAVQLEPENAKFHFALGKGCLDGARYAQAEAAFRRNLELDPEDAGAHAHLGLVLKELIRFGEAKAHIEKAISLDLTNPKWLLNLGLIQTEQDEMAEAERSYRKAIQLDPVNANAYTNLGLVLQYTDRLEEGEAVFRKALELAAKQPGTRKATLYQFQANLALNQMERGKLREGWALFDTRIEAPNWKHLRRDREFPTWEGAALGGRSLLIWREQGLGDEIRAFSCLADLVRSEGGGGIAVECDPRLEQVMRRSFPELEIIAGRAERTRRFDLQLPMSTLPRHFRSSIEAFDGAKPFLVPKPLLLEKWRARLAELPAGKKIGICWRTGLAGANRMWNISKLDDWEVAFLQKGAVFVNLQYGDCEEELRAIESRLGIRIHRWGDLNLKDDLDDILALMANLDLVLTVGTAVNDLAGSVGAPAWVILRTPHQDMLGTDRYPWYPSCRAFGRAWNKPWEEKMGEVAGELAAFIFAGVSRNAPCPCGSGQRFKHCCGS
jgi:tetratricopeptide (TPR) repeat protein